MNKNITERTASGLLRKQVNSLLGDLRSRPKVLMGSRYRFSTDSVACSIPPNIAKRTASGLLRKLMLRFGDLRSHSPRALASVLIFCAVSFVMYTPQANAQEYNGTWYGGPNIYCNCNDSGCTTEISSYGANSSTFYVSINDIMWQGFERGSGYYDVQITKTTNGIGGSYTTDAWVYCNTNGGCNSNYTFETAYPMQAYTSGSLIGPATTTFEATGAIFYPYGGGDSVTVSASGTLTLTGIHTLVDQADCDGNYTLQRDAGGNQQNTGNMAMTVTLGAPAPREEIPAHFYADIQNDCYGRERHIALKIGATTVADIDLVQNYNEFSVDTDNSPIGAPFQYILYDPLSEDYAIISNGVIAPDNPNNEFGSDFYDDARYFHVTCGATPTPTPTASPSASPTPTETGTPTATPTASPSATATATAGGGTPLPTPTGTPPPATPYPTEGVPSPVPSPTLSPDSSASPTGTPNLITKTDDLDEALRTDVIQHGAKDKWAEKMGDWGSCLGGGGGMGSVTSLPIDLTGFNTIGVYHFSFSNSISIVPYLEVIGKLRQVLKWLLYFVTMLYILACIADREVKW